MIYEISLLPVHKEHIEQFRRAFTEVAPLLSRARGYGGHLLAQGIETPQIFNLIVRWQSLEDHTPGFEASKAEPLSALNRPCGRIVMILLPSMSCQASVPCITA